MSKDLSAAVNPPLASTNVWLISHERYSAAGMLVVWKAVCSQSTGSIQFNSIRRPHSDLYDDVPRSLIRKTGIIPQTKPLIRTKLVRTKSLPGHNTP